MITFRGHVGPEDCKIHIDSNYMNENWSEEYGGSFRILKNNHDLDDYVHHITPRAGRLVVFECTLNAWHGHTNFVGPRKSMQFNYVKNSTYLIYEQLRHRVSAFIKKTINKLN